MDTEITEVLDRIADLHQAIPDAERRAIAARDLAVATAIAEGKVRQKDVAQRLNVSRESVRLWQRHAESCAEAGDATPNPGLAEPPHESCGPGGS